MSERSKDRQPQDEDAILAPFFAATRAQMDEGIPDTLNARLLGDALKHLPATTAKQPAKPSAARQKPGHNRPRMRPVGWAADRLGAFGRMLGGAPGLAVVGCAGVAGVWIGVALPDVSPDLVGVIWPDVGLGGDGWAEAAQELGEYDALLAFLDSF
ncbi:MAG: hypothetical protein JJU15_07570 [Pararhodobacter sp.]|nr:hypothetical protein [Pararhodobacter sp.]